MRTACRASFPAASNSGWRWVAIARALAIRPRVLLLDEPLSALDLNSRVKLRHELRRMLLAAAVPSLVVTHDRTEAMALGDFMAVMVDGRLRQLGPVQEVFRRPADQETAIAVGIENVLPAEVESRSNGLLQLRAGQARLECVDRGESGAVLALIRAEDVTISRDLAPVALPELRGKARWRAWSWNAASRWWRW